MFIVVLCSLGECFLSVERCVCSCVCGHAHASGSPEVESVVQAELELAAALLPWLPHAGTTGVSAVPGFWNAGN